MDKPTVMRIGVLTSSRAGYGIYEPLISALTEDPLYSLQLLIAFGTHLSPYYGHTLHEIEGDGYPVAYKLSILLAGDDEAAIASSCALTGLKFADFWSAHRQDFNLVFCLGGRFEMFAAVSAGIPFGIKFAHLYRGNTTLGSIDNLYRHMITLAASLHFVPLEWSRQRVAEITGSSEHIHVIGNLSLDNLKKIPLLSKADFKEKWGIDLFQSTILVTVHPETVAPAANCQHLAALSEALQLMAHDYQLVIQLAANAIIFVVNEQEQLIGSLTDGDVRRGFLRGLRLEDKVDPFLQPNPRFLQRGAYAIEDVINYRKKGFKIIPILDKNNRIVNILNFLYLKSYLPVDAVIMAGGRGERLRPLTDTTPKPLLKVGDKPIIEHNLDRLVSYGIDDIWLSVRYQGEQLETYFGDGAARNINIKYVWEDESLGTLGAVSKIKDFQHEHVLVLNSDLLTDLNYEDFYLDFVNSEASLSVVTIPYTVNVPYAVLETEDNRILHFKEKPTYTYYANGGIYLFKREALALMPKATFFNTTDLMEKLIASGQKVRSYPLRDYWLDIGKHKDYKKAQEDIKHLNL